MSAAHLHAVPDPESGEEPGECPAPSPAPAGPVDLEAPDVEVDDDQEDAEPIPRGFKMPDLRPYYDVRPLAELGPLAVEAGKRSGPPLWRLTCWTGRALRGFLRDLGQMLGFYGRGLLVLLALLAGWLSGAIGKGGSVAARFGIAGFVVYSVVRLSIQYPAAPYLTGGAVLVLLVFAATGRIEAPKKKAAKKSTKGTEKGAKEKAPAAEAEQPADASSEVEKGEAATEPRKGWRARLAARKKAAEEPPPDSPAETPVEDGEEVPAEADPAPTRDDVIRALHDLYEGGSGVLHTALQRRLRLPDTRAVKRVLDEVGIPYRTGVRAAAGNGPGVHTDDFPPLPPAQGSPQGDGVVAGQTANANANNGADAPREGLVVEGTVWTREEVERGMRFIPDPDRGPSAWKIEYRKAD
ncbi:hypothetical protein [Streptomyces murinus]|uniref:hypothetical protein n=1 Tax=Streptomyces murinus TaxID=33900 RepID=UPI0018F707FA|nr:hypothetical protein [Streptomyces murinus]